MKDAIAMRMMDANGNRAREALRVMEDYARFGFNDPLTSAELKTIRHALAAALSSVGIEDALLFRNTAGDVGTHIKTVAETTRESLDDVVIAAGKRLSESLRVLEECAKTVNADAATALERLRYRGYVVEQTLSRFAGGGQLRKRFGKVRLYVLLTESLCHPAAGGWEKMLDAVLQVGGSGGQEEGGGERLCVQLREKGLEDAELLRRAIILATKCRAAGALSIVNDRADIATLAGADGVHLGQGDLGCAEVRKHYGSKLIVGVSTEEISQARNAVRDGATYVAVGPMFDTRTKIKPRLAGPTYAAEVLQSLPADVPVVAIGGITLENMPALLEVGVRAMAVCSAVISSARAAEAAKQFLRAFESASSRVGEGTKGFTDLAPGAR